MLYAGLGSAVLSVPFVSIKAAIGIGIGFALALGLLGLSVMISLWTLDLGIMGLKFLYN